MYTHVCLHTHITYTHTYNGLLLHHEKEGNPDICNNIDETWSHYVMLNEISQIEQANYL